jgi:glycosyltransferase involved in cell wall biosynthesis
MVGFVGGTGGASTMMLSLAEGLIKSGKRPKIVIPAWESAQPFAEACRSSGVDVALTPWLQEREPRARAYHDAVRLVRSCRAPVVHYHLSSNIMPGRYATVMRWLPRGHTLATIHHPYDDPPAGTPSADRWARTAARLFDQVVCVSRIGLERQRHYGVPPDRLRLIYNGVDLHMFMNGRGERVRAELGLGRLTPLLVVSARVADQKRPLDAVSILARLADSIPDAHLAFVGEGPLQSLVRQTAEREGLSSRVHLVGHRFDVADWLAAATVWLLPTESEALQPCLSVVEAMAAGCAIVTTRCRGDEGILVDGENALLARVGDVDAMAGAVSRLFADPALRQRLGASARDASRTFSAEEMTAAYMDLYAGVGPNTSEDAGVDDVHSSNRVPPTAKHDAVSHHD